MIEIISLSR